MAQCSPGADLQVDVDTFMGVGVPGRRGVIKRFGWSS
jgi:hypothetical protein